MTQPEPLRLADALEKWAKDYASTEYWDEMGVESATELRRLHHNNEVLMNALWKACGDDEDVVNATIESQGDLK